MEAKLTARELKRIASDKKILRATVEIVGKKGFTHANIRDIAKEAGITPGLIMQRFETKENLLVEAIRSTDIVWKDYQVSKDTDVERILRGIIINAKKLYDEDNDAYRFVKVISGSSDIPKGVVDRQIEYFRVSGIQDVIEEAQKEGKLPEGNAAILYNIFVSHTLRLIWDYKMAGLRIPDDDNILAMIQYKAK
ncbi:MAG: TetR/AcrR family transcriptional regulator [Lachnospiraceae bacterium]|nr:TetR/AcrR family transcriptional regulator [Lachnospiraceae bacterium]